MGKLKLFIDNFLIFGLGSIINKLIPFFMLPVVTRLMPSSKYFGLSDLTQSLVTFASAFAIMGMYDASFRLFFDKKEEKFQKAVCSTALLYVIFNSFCVFILLLLATDYITVLFFGSNEYKILLYFAALSVFIGATNSILMIPSRVQNKRIIFLLVNLVTSVVSYSVSVFLLLQGYYLIALPIAALFSALTTGISFYAINRKWFDYKLFDFVILKDLLSIGLPIMPIIFIYWILSSIDRIMIVHFIGEEAAGVYAAAAKIASVSQLIYMAFAGGWQYFAFSTMNEENQVKNNSLVFEYLGILVFMTTGFVCALSHWVISFFYPNSYLYGYIVVPYLFISPLILMLYQVIGNQFLVIKKTWPSALIVICGACVNILCNYFLIPILGIEGAGIATLAGYMVALFVCVIVLIKMKLLELSQKFSIAVLLFAANSCSWYVYAKENLVMGIVIAVCFFIAYILLYRKEISVVLKNIKNYNQCQ